MEIIKHPDQRLRMFSAPVETIDDSIRSLVEDMISIVEKENALGLAAVQIGLPIKVMVARLYKKSNRPRAFINPKIIWISPKKVVYPESCLSIPDRSINVTRPERVKVKAISLIGDMMYEEFVDYRATLVQHEIDHLNGKLIIDYVDENV